MTETSATAPTSPSNRPSVVLDLVVLDTDQPRHLAEFYAALLGWEIVDERDDWVTIRSSTGSGGASSTSLGLAFQLAINHVPPTWPSGAVPQQFHLDLEVTDPAEAGRFAESLGARRVPGAGVERSFTVYLDPSGHPFCLCVA